jgi:hypothetical protein
VHILRKINALIKYEFINLKRGTFIWVMVGLYAFGVQQSIASMYLGGSSFLSLVDLIKVSWLPLNFIMIPVLLLSMKIGKSENEIFNTMDISPKEIFMSKVATVGIITGVILALNIILATTIAIVCRVSIQYFIYQSIGYIINTVIFLVVCSSLGLLIGQTIGKHVGEIIAYITIIVLFIIMCNFYKASNVIVPLINIRSLPSSFDVISYDKSYLYHNIFWIIMTLIFLMLSYRFHLETKQKRKFILLRLGVLLLSCAACTYLAVGIYSMKPSFYNYIRRNDAKIINNNNTTFYADENSGYYIDKYIMDIDISNKLKNNCEMEIGVNKDSVKSVELGLYGELIISKVEIDGSKLSFNRTNNSFTVNLPKEYKNGEKLKMKVSYEGEINTKWINQGHRLFFLRNNTMFLADVFEWYPKLNDNTLKEYNVNIKYNGNNKIYSNLNDENKAGEYKLSGKDREVFLISGNIIERKYKDYLFIGNEEYVNSDKKCDSLIKVVGRERAEAVTKIVLAQFIPGGGTSMDKYYEKAYLYTRD